MAEIHVTFLPASGGRDIKPIVRQDRKMAMQGEYIYWHLISYDDNVKGCEIKFDDDDALFFPNSHTCTVSNSQTKLFKDGKVIWGKVPGKERDSQTSDQTTVENDSFTVHPDKYKVYGLNGEGDQLTGVQLDPEIITDRPRK